MRITKKVLSLILSLVMVLGLLPAAVFASGTEQVYISVSFDGQYIPDQNGEYIAYAAVPMEQIAAVDLNEYGLSDYLYDEDGDGIYETTALQMVIYTHENIYGGSWDDVSFTGSPGSSYFQGGIFGFTENLNYYLNGEYPLASAGWGATSDQIVLEAGDYLDIASFSSWDFYGDSNYGFHFFADSEGAFTHNFTAEAGTAVSVKLVRSYSGMGSGAAVYDEPGYTVSYGTSLYNAAGTVTTDDAGAASITFPAAGTWYLWADGGYGLEYPNSIVSSAAYAEVTVTAAEEEEDEEEEETTRTAQDVSAVLDATMAQMAATVTAPVFGTTAGEWTVLSLARGGYYAKENAYFTDYYNRIVETVNETAASVNLNGALHAVKSTENSRLIAALSSIGKNATDLGDWNLITPYDDFTWVKKQGINGTIWALIALDSNNYATADTTIRQQCVDSILSLQHDDGGWSLMANTALASDPDITGMALQALYPYRDQEAVADACAEAFACLSTIQNDNGSYSSGGSENAESCAQVIVACATWGINPDTDSRFIKNDKSVVDALLAHYLADEAEFQHIIGAGSNAMATDQACYALVAYDRLLNGKAALYDYSDVTFDAVTPDSGEESSPDEEGSTGTITLNTTLGLPAQVENTVGTTFNAVISIDKWDNEAGFKLVDFIMTIPEGLSVTGVAAGDRVSGGEVSYNLDADGNLRSVYFDANENNPITISGTEYPAELFTVSFQIAQELSAESLTIAIAGMSVKLSSDSTSEDAMIIVNTEPVTDPDNPDGGTTGGSGNIGVVTGVSFSAVCLYTGDDVDLIPSTRKAVAVAVTGITNGSKLSYNDGTNAIEFNYSAEITAKTGISTYVALVDSSIAMENFVNKNCFTITSTDAATITFADTNSDGVINAQDALAVVDAWLRKGETPTDNGILTMNVNGDSRINTFDALGIVEAFVGGSTYGVVTKASTVSATT